jgi:hypothetical protein
MIKKKNTKSNQQLQIINDRLEKLVDKMNKDYNNCVQELLQLTTLLQNIEHGFTDTNEMLLRK